MIRQDEPEVESDDPKGRLAGVSEDRVAGMSFDWLVFARAAQLPPLGNWTTWLLLGGRGAGKTRTGAEWIRGLAMGLPFAAPKPVSPIALVSETITEARAVMVEGMSGVLSISPPAERPKLISGKNRLEWPNGAVAQLFGAGDPESLRGPQFAAAWCDEAAKWSRAEAAFDMLQFGLRLGDHPRQLITTTPRPTPLIRRLVSDPAVRRTHMRSTENRKNLAQSFFSAITARYEHTALGRQELDGELIEDDPNALWQRDLFDRHRMNRVPELERIVIAIDPPVTSHARSDACGIIAAGRRGERAVVIEDLSLRPAPPIIWARRAVEAFHRLKADVVIAETNQGGELVTGLLRQVDPDVPVRAVHAKRGKWTRAEPVAALYARGLVSHVGLFAELEDEMCAFGPNGLSGGGSPDRVDALVWALNELMLNSAIPRIRGL